MSYRLQLSDEDLRVSTENYSVYVFKYPVYGLWGRSPRRMLRIAHRVGSRLERKEKKRSDFIETLRRANAQVRE